MVKQHFQDQSEFVYAIIKKVFCNFKQAIAYKEYHYYVTKFVSLDFKSCKERFFNYVDMNKDGLVCETDLFKLMKSMVDFRMSDIIIDDLLLVLKKLERVRVEEGKHD